MSSQSTPTILSSFPQDNTFSNTITTEYVAAPISHPATRQHVVGGFGARTTYILGVVWEIGDNNVEARHLRAASGIARRWARHTRQTGRGLGTGRTWQGFPSSSPSSGRAVLPHMSAPPPTGPHTHQPKLPRLLPFLRDGSCFFHLFLHTAPRSSNLQHKKMASFLRARQAGIQTDLSAGIAPTAFNPDELVRYGVGSQIRYVFFLSSFVFAM